MAVTFRSFTAASGNVGDRPAGLANGDVMVALVESYGAPPNPTTCSGWTRAVSLAYVNDQLELFYRYVDDAASEPATYTFSPSSGFNSVIIGCYSGCDPASPWDDEAATQNGSDDNASASVTVARDGSAIIWAQCSDGLADGDQPSGFTFRAAVDAGSLYSDRAIDAGSSGSFSGNLTGGHTSVVAVGVLQPPGSVAPASPPSLFFGSGSTG